MTWTKTEGLSIRLLTLCNRGGIKHNKTNMTQHVEGRGYHAFQHAILPGQRRLHREP
jgi:hypothetical protein